KIHSFQSVGGVAFSEKQQQERIDRWKGFWTTEKKQWLTQQLISSGRHVGFKENTFEPFFTSLSHSFTRLDPMDQRLLDTLFLGEFISTQAHLTTVTTVVKTDVNEADLLVQSLAD